MDIYLADSHDLERIDHLYRACIQYLNTQEIYQWDDQYPNIETYITYIDKRQLYLFEEDESLIGAVIINEVQADEWQMMDWKSRVAKSRMIHALTINPDFQGKGYGQQVLKACETLCMDQGFSAIRLDAFSENPAAINLYEKNGYKKVGTVHFDYKPEGHQAYHCYEKLM